jgi:cellobiose phosphorylase
MKENGSVFCHVNPWAGIGQALTGDGDEAFRIFRLCCPSYTEDQSDIRETEPYVYCQTIAGGEAPCQGRGRNSWLTGASAWFFVFVSQYILGIRPTLKGLTLRPCLPAELNGYRVKRLYRGCVYRVEVQKKGAARTLTVNGEPFSGECLPCKAGSVYDVRLEI